MSYIRAAWEMRFVEGESKDYVFLDVDGWVEDYGSVTAEGLIEMLWMHWGRDDDAFKEYILKKLAEKLNVKLRETPLTFEESFAITAKRVEESEEIKEIWKLVREKDDDRKH